MYAHIELVCPFDMDPPFLQFNLWQMFRWTDKDMFVFSATVHPMLDAWWDFEWKHCQLDRSKVAFLSDIPRSNLRNCLSQHTNEFQFPSTSVLICKLT